MFKEIAIAVKLDYKETLILRQSKIYELSNNKFNFSFSVMIDPRNGNVVIISRSFKLGNYKKEDLMNTAKREIIAKIKEKMK